MWIHTDLISVLKVNYVADYNVGNKAICNGRIHIPSSIIMTWLLRDVDDVNSEVPVEYIE